MKTQLIPLESHDDTISIRDKMSWAKTPRILLVWPPDGQVDVRPLDLTLLRRHATSLGAELGLVTRNAEIRSAARQLDLPVFSKPAHAQRKIWPMRVSVYPGRRAPRLDLRTVRTELPNRDVFHLLSRSALARLVVFTIGVFAVLMVPLFFIPTAEIRLTPPTRPQSIEIDVSAEPAIGQVSLTGVIPSRLHTFEISLTDSIPSSGQTIVPSQSAEGMLHLTNLAVPIVDVPAGTVVVTLTDPPVRFATVEAVQVPLGIGSSADVRARAVEPGASGNLPPVSLTAFDGPLGLSLRVTNPSAMTGGTNISTPAPTEADYLTSHKRLLQALEARARQHLLEQFKPGDVVFTNSFAFSKIADETFTPAIGQAGRNLTVTLRVAYQAYYASAADLQQLAASVLDASMSVRYMPIDNTLKISSVSPLFGSTNGLTRWRIRASRMLRARIDSAQVIALAQGQTAERAGSLLSKTFRLESAPQIRIQPFFWPWLPSLPFQIKVSG